MKTHILFPTLFLFLGLAAPVEAKLNWETDFETAKKIAEKDKKDILVEFTGSDWCHACIEMEKEIFSSKEFATVIPKNFVLLKLDFPMNKEVDPAIAKVREALKNKFAVEGFPTLVMTDGAGKPFAKTGYFKVGPERYVSMLTDLGKTRAKRDSLFAQAKKAEGLEKAQLLDQGLKTMEIPQTENFYAEEVNALIEADTKDTLGWKKRRDLLANLGKLEATVNKAFNTQNYPSAITAIDAFIKDNKLKGLQKQSILMNKFQVYQVQQKPKEMLGALEEVIEAGPRTQLGMRATQQKMQLLQVMQQLEGAAK